MCSQISETFPTYLWILFAIALVSSVLVTVISMTVEADPKPGQKAVVLTQQGRSVYVSLVTLATVSMITFVYASKSHYDFVAQVIAG